MHRTGFGPRLTQVHEMSTCTFAEPVARARQPAPCRRHCRPSRACRRENPRLIRLPGPEKHVPFGLGGTRRPTRALAAGNMDGAQLLRVRVSISDLVGNIACMDCASEAVWAAAAESTARPHSSPTVDVRDALRQGWVLWWSSSISADYRLHAAISPPSVPTVPMASAGSMLKGWDLSNLGKP